MASPPHDPDGPRPHSGSRRARFIVPAMAAGLLVVWIVFALTRHADRQTVSGVIREIHQTALAGNEPDAPRNAGIIGPWRISAEDCDAISGKLRKFHLTSGRMMISAETAAVRVDPEEDTFTIEMWDVVFVRVPEEEADEVGPGAESFVHSMDHYVLGPAPYGADIVRDGR